MRTQRFAGRLPFFTMAILSIAAAGGCSSTLDRQTVGIAAPVPELKGEFNNISRDGRLYFAGEPSEEAIREMARRGATVVVDIRPEGAARTHQFDERALVESLGMEYIQIPISAESLSAADVRRFAEVMRETDGEMLLHCRSSNTSGGLWAAYLARHKGFPLNDAIERGKAAGLARPDMIEAVTRVVAEEPVK